MNPILYEATETEFKSNGLGRLTECVTCLVTEERNGIYECEFQYPITGKRYADIQEGRIISVTHDDKKDRQPFVIYRRSAPINGIVTFNAHHISYALSYIVTKPFHGSITAANALASLKANSINANPFTFWTNNTASGNIALSVPRSVMNALKGMKGSVLDVFGGEYEFDKWQVKLYAQRGNANGVTIRYGKNLTDINYETDILDLYDAIVPYWMNETSVGWGSVNIGGSGWNTHKAVAMDFSSEFEELPSADQLNARATTYLSNNRPWIPKANIEIDFVALWQTEEYKNIAPLERVRLCDTVKVIYTELGVEATAKVIKTVWNPLLDRYDSLELGEAKTSFADIIAKEATDSATAEVPTTSMMQKAIDHATDLITGGLGGNIVIQYDGNGKPTEILVMDTDDVSTAVHVLRINVNGIGFSSNGINGPYTSAWTLDGQFVADFITAGHMRFNMMQGGILSVGGDNDGDGTISVYDSDGNVIATIDNNGIDIKNGEINLGNGVFIVDRDGKMFASDATINGEIRNVFQNDWCRIFESQLTGGYGQIDIANVSGLLDLSAEYADNTRKVALEAILSDLLLSVGSSGRIILMKNGYQQAAVGSSYNSDPKSNTAVDYIYFSQSGGTMYMGFAPYSGTTYFATLTASDEKLKTNIKPAKNIGLETINKIEHKSFDYIDGGYHRECGYIAQQLQEAIPYSTIAAPECDEDGNQTGELLQIVDHEVLVYATKAIQELSKKVEELERRLQEVI